MPTFPKHTTYPNPLPGTSIPPAPRTGKLGCRVFDFALWQIWAWRSAPSAAAHHPTVL